LDVVKCLISHGANIHVKNDYAFRWASGEGNLDVVNCLIKNGADIHAENDGSLRWASAYGHSAVVELLNNHINNEKKSKEIEELQKQVIDIQNKINDLMKTQ